jgi:hypothetical protein
MLLSNFPSAATVRFLALAVWRTVFLTGPPSPPPTPSPAPSLACGLLPPSPPTWPQTPPPTRPPTEPTTESPGLTRSPTYAQCVAQTTSAALNAGIVEWRWAPAQVPASSRHRHCRSQQRRLKARAQTSRMLRGTNIIFLYIFVLALCFIQEPVKGLGRRLLGATSATTAELVFGIPCGCSCEG